VRRRLLLAGGIAALMPQLALSQKLARIGLLWLESPEVGHLRRSLIEGLREHGFVDARNLAVEDGTVAGYEQLEAAAHRLVERKVDVIVTWGYPALIAARRATRSIPILMNSGIDPVKAGVAASLARPAGNVTGILTINEELFGKQAQLIHETLPRARRVLALVDATSGAQTGYFDLLEPEARRIGIEFRAVKVRGARDLGPAFADAARAKLDAVYVVPSTMLQGLGSQIGELALKHRLPSFAYAAEFAAGGVLLIYGVDRSAIFRRMADYAARILKGTAPGELPIERPAEFELVLNLKTAKALGIAIPPAVRLRATRTIE
jgi:putative ABC transport system substrate-binding protein